MVKFRLVITENCSEVAGSQLVYIHLHCEVLCKFSGMAKLSWWFALHFFLTESRGGAVQVVSASALTASKCLALSGEWIQEGGGVTARFPCDTMIVN